MAPSITQHDVIMQFLKISLPDVEAPVESYIVLLCRPVICF